MAWRYFWCSRGYLLILLSFIGTVLALEGENKLPANIQNAQSTPLISQSAKYFAGFLPNDYSDKLLSNLIDHKGVTGTATEAINKMIDDSVSIVKKPLELLNDEKTN